MKGFTKRGSRGEKGFTLVELLIVFTLLGVLAAIIVPNVIGLMGFGQGAAALTELSIVQTAVDTMMIQSNITTVTATNATANMSAFPIGRPLYPNYVRTQLTKGTYSCSTNGSVTQATTGY